MHFRSLCVHALFPVVVSCGSIQVHTARRIQGASFVPAGAEIPGATGLAVQSWQALAAENAAVLALEPA